MHNITIWHLYMLQNDHPYIYLLNLTDSSLIFWYADKMSLLFVSVPPAAASLTPSTLFLLIHWMDWKPESWACLIYVQMKNPQALGESWQGSPVLRLKMQTLGCDIYSQISFCGGGGWNVHFGRFREIMWIWHYYDGSLYLQVLGFIPGKEITGE